MLGKIGESAARELFLTGERFEAVRAVEIGLVRAAVPEEDLDATVEAPRRGAAEGRARARSRRPRRSSARSPGGAVEDVQRYTVERIADLRVSAEGQEGMRAFLEKRKPDWSR